MLRPRGENSSAPHVGMAYAHIANARVCLVGMQSVRTAGLGRASDEEINSPSFRFDEGASAEAKLALIMPSEEEKGGKAPTGGRRAG